MENEYLHFVLDESSAASLRKTQTWLIYSVRNGDRLGVIQWFGRWRQYAFFPERGTVWNRDCLATVHLFIGDLQQKRKEQLRASRS